MSETKYIGGISGGIDSQAVAGYMINRYGAENVILLNSQAGRWEHPLTVEHVAWYSANVHPVIEVVPRIADVWQTPGYAETKGLDGNAELTMVELCKIKGRAPSRTAQFCTSILKLKPQLRWIQENLAGQHYIRFTGKRRDESESRKDTPFTEWDTYYDCELWHPIADWTKEMCFDFINSRRELINPLYSLGFNRVGCAPCINSGKDDILAWEQRFPEMIDKVRDLEHETGRNFFAPMVPGIPLGSYNTIDQVIEWAKTDRGGKQYNAFRILNDRPACESKYGLCE